ncbi:MAG: nicotinamide-nucleotide adenylyltransferase, partial [Abditibacteriota bacterium]|nr:nicotinamide-nucleotide adenylyltransferase [Abditibacteriota bacterium]
LEPTVAFVQDGTRNEEIRKNREECSEQIKKLFDEFGFKYHCVDGDYAERFESAKILIKETFGI